MLRTLFGALTFAYALTVVAVMYQSASMWERHASGRSIEGPVDGIIVLGGGIDGDGVLGYASRRRAAGAVEAAERLEEPLLVFSGRARAEYPDRPTGALMADYARTLGLPRARALAEPGARNTLQNLRFGTDLARVAGAERLAIATDPYHLTRAATLARWMGLGEVELIAAPGQERLSAFALAPLFAREALAWWVNAIRIGAWEAEGLLGLKPVALDIYKARPAPPRQIPRPPAPAAEPPETEDTPTVQAPQSAAEARP